MLVRVDFEDAKSFGRNKLITKVGNKKKQVLLLVSVDNTNIREAVDFAVGNPSVASLVYEGTEQYFSLISELDTKGVYICKVEQVGEDVSEESIAELLQILPAWATLVVELPETYKNMEFICKMCEKYPRVRFSGGYLFNFSDARLGICGDDVLEKLNSKPDVGLIREGDCCGTPVVNFNEVEISIATAKDRVSTGSSEKSSPKKKTISFGDLFGGNSAFGSVGSL